MITPTGIQARFAAGWAYLTVPTQTGATIEVEALLNGSWTAVHRYGTEYLVQMYADGRPTEWRARYQVDGQPGPWRTGRVAFPDVFVEDSTSAPDDVTGVAAPTGLRVTSHTNGRVTVAWDAAPDITSWRVQLGQAAARTVTTPADEFIGLEPGTYSWSVVAVHVDADGYEHLSQPATATFTVADTPTPPDPGKAPEAPRNVRAHCITDRSAKVEWDRDPEVMEYEVWIDPHRGEAQHTASTLVVINGLTQATQYTAMVVAHNAHGSSEPSHVVFHTGVPEPVPDPDPDIPVEADWPAPDLTVQPLEGGKVRATWTDPDDGTKPKSQMGYPYWHVSLDQRTWYFTRERQWEFDVAPGAQVMVSVYGVWDNSLTEIATKGVAL